MINEESIWNALRLVEDPDLKKDLVTLGMIRNMRISDNEVSFEVCLTTPACPMKDMLENACRNAVLYAAGRDVKVDIRMTSEVNVHRNKKEGLSGVSNIIAVASGKGGVGKSTVAAELARAFNRAGASVGLLDADIYGPSIPLLFNAEHDPVEMDQADGKELMRPVFKEGIKLFSIGFLSKPGEAIVWRGPMVSQAIRQFMSGVNWGKLDYLIVDLPPGTGDVQLTLVQNLPVTGSVVVTTPQKLAQADADRACAMFALPAVAVPILGIIENMSWFTPPGKPDEIYHPFGKTGSSALAEKYQTDIIGRLPLIDQSAETGHENLFSQYFTEIAGKLVRNIAVKYASTY